MNLAYREYGRGQPLIILHGLFGSSDNWHSMCKLLGESFRVFALDQRNHGGSPHSWEMNYHLMAEDLHDFLNQQGLAQAHVLGHSLGGKAAMQFALLFPAGVEKLIIADVSPRAYPPHHQGILNAMLALDPGEYETRRRAEAALAPAIPDLALRQFLLKNLTRNSQGRFDWKIGLREINQNYSALCEAIRSDRPWQQQALFIRGEKSQYLNELDLPLIHTLFPQAQLRTISRAGHLLQVENPQAFLNAVLDFLINSKAP
jgi:esterase